MIDQIRERLIRVARAEDVVCYSEIGEMLNLSMDNPNHRNELAHLLGVVSTAEHDQCRPLLSAVVVHKENLRPGKGFFQLAKDLKKQHPGEDDDVFYIAELKRLYDQWR